LISWLASVYPMVDDPNLLRVWFHFISARRRANDIAPSRELGPPPG
jgi:hypothetical protein